MSEIQSTLHLPSSTPCPWLSLGVPFPTAQKHHAGQAHPAVPQTLGPAFLLLPRPGILFLSRSLSPSDSECHLTNAFSSVKRQFRYEFLKHVFLKKYTQDQSAPSALVARTATAEPRNGTRALSGGGSSAFLVTEPLHLAASLNVIWKEYGE